MNADEQAIRDLVALWISATKAGDHATVLTLMTDDVIYMTPGREPFGKEAFAVPKEPTPPGMFDGTAEVLEVQVHGDWAWARNFLDVTIPPGGQPMRLSGYTLGIYRRNAEGKWQLFRDANFVGPTTKA